MRKALSVKETSEPKRLARGLMVALSLVAAISCTRSSIVQNTPAGIQREKFSEEDLVIRTSVGKTDSIFYVKHGAQTPVGDLIYFHGSAGPDQFTDEESESYARLGYRVLSLCWYHCSRGSNNNGVLPPIEKIDLEKIRIELDTLFSRQQIKRETMIFVGGSRGAELVGLLTSREDTHNIKPRAAVMISGASRAAYGRLAMPVSALRGAVLKGDKGNSYTSSVTAWLDKSLPVPTGTLIEMNKFSGELLLIHGARDPLWPSRFSEELKRAYDRPEKKAEIIIFPEEAHALSASARTQIRSAVDRFYRKTFAPAKGSALTH